MIFYSDKSVYEAALDRIRFIFDEFYPQRKIAVCISGGKDSTVVMHLVKEVMDERGISKIPVLFLDQEVEAPQVIDYVRSIMKLPWVEPIWIQSYFQEWNSSAGEWFNVWGPGEKWIREKEPDNPYTDIHQDVIHDFNKVMDSVTVATLGKDYVTLGGVRIDESPSRRLGLTSIPCYKDITWGKQAKGGLVLYPIWDWRTYDVWYYIFSNKLPYCKLYNYYMTMKPLIKCRVSSFIHENSIQSLAEIKEIAPQFYEKALVRVANINTTVQSLNGVLAYAMSSLPPYFNDYDEYITYLAEHLIADPVNAAKIVNGFKTECRRFKKKCGNWEEGWKNVYNRLGQLAAHCVVKEDNTLSGLYNGELSLIKYIGEHQNDIERANKSEL